MAVAVIDRTASSAESLSDQDALRIGRVDGAVRNQSLAEKGRQRRPEFLSHQHQRKLLDLPGLPGMATNAYEYLISISLRTKKWRKVIQRSRYGLGSCSWAS